MFTGIDLGKASQTKPIFGFTPSNLLQVKQIGTREQSDKLIIYNSSDIVSNIISGITGYTGYPD